MSLTELLVTLALAGILGTAALGMLEQGQRAWTIGAARAESQQSVRVALARLAADVRAAGFGGEGFDAVGVAETQRIVLQQDQDGDGAVASAGEQVTWRLAGSVLRRDAGGGAQPVINGVRLFALSYFDARGIATSLPGDVRSIGIELATAPDGPVAAAPAATVATRIRLRNR